MARLRTKKRKTLSQVLFLLMEGHKKRKCESKVMRHGGSKLKCQLQVKGILGDKELFWEIMKVIFFRIWEIWNTSD